MKNLIAIEVLLEKDDTNQNDLQELVKMFCKREATVMKIDWTPDAYENARSCYDAMIEAAESCSLPVKVTLEEEHQYVLLVKN
jgi:hypothetical protein